MRGDKAAAGFHPPCHPLSRRQPSARSPALSRTIPIPHSKRVTSLRLPASYGASLSLSFSRTHPRSIVNPGPLIRARVNTLRLTSCAGRMEIRRVTSIFSFFFRITTPFPLRSMSTRASGFRFHLSRVRGLSNRCIPN